MEHLTKSDFKPIQFVARFHNNEEGKVSLLASMLMLALVSLAGLIGNTGHVAKEKIETQNAADSIAYSSSLWMARGMNALTATNHMLGEATAIAAIHESFGGPEMDLGLRRNTAENKALDTAIQALSKSAPVIPSPYSPPPIPNLDKPVVKFVTDRTSPSGGDGKMNAFATIYDSRMALKRQLAITLTAKSLANIGFMVPPPWGFATAAIAYGVHIAGTANIVLIGKEWFVLEAFEAIAGVLKPVKKVVETQLIPTLSAHAEFVAGYDLQARKAKPGIVNGAVERVVLDLEKRLDVEASLFPKFEKLVLPVEPEPKPTMRGPGPNLQGWGSDKTPVFPMPELNAGKMQRKLDRAVRRMQRRVEKLNKDISDLDKFERDIDKRLGDNDVSAQEKTKLRKEKTEIQESREEKRRRISEIETELAKMEAEKAKLDAISNQTIPSDPNNPSIKSIPRLMDRGQAVTTQWVRATYPQVDAFRAPIRAWLKKWAPKSKAADHFDKWTNRYTLVKSWQFRSGYRARKSQQQITWNKRKKPLSMLVMQDSFRGTKSQKGKENWTRSDSSSKRKAEELFTLIGIAHRDYKPLFSEVLYPAPSDSGMTSYTQSIFYNANKQQPSSSSQTQPKIGWDTLNWDPEINVPEWGAKPHETAPKWPWEAFDGSAQKAVAKVKLNWQAKLMPVRPKRLQEASVTVEGEARKNLEHAAEYFEKLGNH